MGKELKDMTNEELWQLFPIILCEHNPLWIDRYRITKVEITKGYHQIFRHPGIFFGGNAFFAGLFARSR